MPPLEVLLPLGACGLYLFDSVMLFYSNELLFLQARGGRWRFSAGSSRFILFGRAVCMPNPLMPNRPQFRVRWSDRDPRADREDLAEVERFTSALRPVQYLVLTLLLLLLALPVELIWFGTGVELLALFAAFYGVILVTLGCIYARRDDLRVSGKAFAMLCVDSLACAPFAINLVRKLSMRRSLAGNPIGFARNAFNPETFAELVRAVCGRVDDEQQREDKVAPRWGELQAYREGLLAMLDETATSIMR
jgi:hypothetical protein